MNFAKIYNDTRKKAQREKERLTMTATAANPSCLLDFNKIYQEAQKLNPKRK
jgi:hypothetical protein